MKANANINSGHILCCHCEESVHAYATHCPYCQKSLLPESSPANTKITTLQQAQTPENPFVNFQQMSDDAHEAPPATFTGQAFSIIISLATLLAGSFFFFFGILIKLYSSNGVFTLEWNASSWPYFVLASVVFVIVGLTTLAKIEK